MTDIRTNSLGATRLRAARSRRVAIAGFGVALLLGSALSPAGSAPLPPVAHDDDYTTPVDAPLVLSVPGVLTNDVANGGSLRAQRLTSPAVGTLKLNVYGRLVYTPPAGFEGRVSFTYRAYKGYFTRPIRSDAARVTITVGSPSPERKIGVAADVFERNLAVLLTEEAAIGNLVADSMRVTYGTQLALTNAGGIRSALPSSFVPSDPGLDRTAPAPYDLVAADASFVHPFGTRVVTRTVTGAQLWAALESGVATVSPPLCTSGFGRFPQISGFKFTYVCTNVSGSRIATVALTDGTPIPPNGSTYTIAVNDFINTGGDNYTVFADGQGLERDTQANVLIDYIASVGTVTPTTDDRIIKLSDVCRTPLASGGPRHNGVITPAC